MPTGDTAIVLFTRDLRVHDHPALAAACRAHDRVVPLFVYDPAFLNHDGASRNRHQFLAESLADLRASLSARGGQLFLRAGDPVHETLKMAEQTAAAAIYLSADFSNHAQQREQRLAKSCESERIRLCVHPGVTVVPPREIVPAGGDHYRVFTPYWNRWRLTHWRTPLGPPRSISVPSDLAIGRQRSPATRGRLSKDLPTGGETEGRRRLQSWLRRWLGDYDDNHDALAADHTSRLSPYLHFGCLSPTEIAHRALRRPGGEGFVRQLCWRDFHHQVMAAFPQLPYEAYRPRSHRWRDDPAGLEAWRQGMTGLPIVDAGMRQLLAEGWMHNRSRLLVAAYLTRGLAIDWRLGAAHFMDWLVDADLANNSGNWQWVAGTGNDTRPNRRFNLLRQAQRFDPQGEYVRRYVTELSDVPGPAVHQPWKFDADKLSRLRYPAPILEPPG